MPPPRLRILAIAPALGLMLGLAAGLTGCAEPDQPVAASAGSAPGSTTPAPRPPRAKPSPPAPTGYHHYVALGDSYTAAPLVPPTDTGSICLRSEVNYPALVAAALPGATLTDVSCSGARTSNIRAPQTGFDDRTVPPQLDAVRPGTDLVTIGLGGNDDGLFANVLGRCLQLAGSDPDGAPCRAALDGSDLDETFAGIRASIAGVVADVEERAPQARVLVIGYPQIVPASGRCDLLRLAAGDYPFARSLIADLNRAVRDGARDAGAEYVDLWAPSAGHDICAEDPWINGRVTSADTALAYHPLAAEQRAVADLVLDALR